MRALWITAVLLLQSCADIRQPVIAGSVSAVSLSDISAIMTTARAFLIDEHHEDQPIFRLQIMNDHYVRAYYGEHYGSNPPAFYETYVEVVRDHGKWSANIGVISGRARLDARATEVGNLDLNTLR
jgi:hypothetical protein